MTYCLGKTVKEGIIAISHTRITAGNEIYSNKKKSIHEIKDHSLFIMSAGLRSVRDKAVIYFNQAVEEQEAAYNYMHEAATAFGPMLKKVAIEDRETLEKEGYQLTHDSSLKDALKMGFLSFDATEVSTNDVDYPIDVVDYEKDSFKAKEVRLYKKDMQKIYDESNTALRNSLESIDEAWMKSLISLPRPFSK